MYMTTHMHPTKPKHTKDHVKGYITGELIIQQLQQLQQLRQPTHEQQSATISNHSLDIKSKQSIILGRSKSKESRRWDTTAEL
mmetsp:Transcript_11906/g.32770  ORF Transcript_11906/g.32770 Transcript_11906/m.32770 type:complete len:83 (+) Transcript_11906:461-709(+)